MVLLAGVVTSAILAVFYGSTTDGVTGGAYLIASVLWGLILFMLARRRNVATCARLTCVVFFLLMSASLIRLGGVQSPLFSQTLLLPMAASILLGMRDGWFWVFVTCMIPLGFLAADRAGWSPVHRIDPDLEIYVFVAMSIAAQIIVGFLASIWVLIPRTLEGQIQTSAEKLAQASGQVDLLLALANSSNRSRNLGQAAVQCCRLVARKMDWQVGHAWVRSEEKSKGLVSLREWHMEEAARYRLFREITEDLDPQDRDCLPARVAAARRPLVFPDLKTGLCPARLLPAQAAGLCSGIAFPVIQDEEVCAVIELFSRNRILENDLPIDVLENMGTQLARVAERDRARSDIEWMAYHDSLTRLPNRRAFEEMLVNFLEGEAPDTAVLLFLDVNKFKDVNDAFGHHVGDELLWEVANRVTRSVRAADGVFRPIDSKGAVSRYAGDEFTVLIQGVRDDQVVERIVQRLLNEVEKPLSIAGEDIVVSASVGIARYPDDAENAEDLLQAADAAMYDAKEVGGGAFRFFDPGRHARGAERLAKEREVRRAIVEHEIVLFYQPLFRTEDRELVGAEALVRWDHPERGLLSPMEFIPLAEESGLIVELGQRIVEMACAQSVRWNRDRASPVRISVNISARQFDIEFVDWLEGALERTGCAPSWLELEVTESAILGDHATTEESFLRIKEIGLSLALDDFGTGYSSLSHLQKVPLSRLKIDRSFVRNLPDDLRDGQISSGIIQIAHSLGLEVVAEGVESEEQVAFLRANHCDVLQGFLLGRPEPAEQFGKRLRGEVAPG